MKRVLIWLLVAVTALTIAFPSFGADESNPLIIDVRTEAEWNDGHIEGAILIPYESIGAGIEAVTKDRSKRICVYCRSGRRSKVAKESLEKLGYRDVVNLGSLEDAARKMKRRIVK
ncbi:MAG: rhodanese-like domain-containing protein [Deltaproteobacteria bacterium]|nr:rhodanese-like domain-containing protein [Deltaproteobacteria bacterium]